MSRATLDYEEIARAVRFGAERCLKLVTQQSKPLVLPFEFEVPVTGLADCRLTVTVRIDPLEITT